MSEALHVIVTGKVQGVNFRQSTREYARGCGVVGWVRNLPDGSVEVLAEGERSNLERLLNFVRHGPPYAQVTEVQAEWQLSTGVWHSFEVQW